MLTELIHAAHADRPGVFSARRAEIIEDCRAALKDVTSTELVDYVDMLDEALTVAEVGHLAAAQSLAASVFDTILRHTIKPQRVAGYYARVKIEITDRHENASMTELRWGLVHVAGWRLTGGVKVRHGRRFPSKVSSCEEGAHVRGEEGIAV